LGEVSGSNPTDCSAIQRPSFEPLNSPQNVLEYLESANWNRGSWAAGSSPYKGTWRKLRNVPFVVDHQL